MEIVFQISLEIKILENMNSVEYDNTLWKKLNSLSLYYANYLIVCQRITGRSFTWGVIIDKILLHEWYYTITNIEHYCHALTRWALWTGCVSYSLISEFGICGAARSSDQSA